MKKLGSYVLSTPYQKRANDMRKEAGGECQRFNGGHLIAQTMAASIPDSTAACSTAVHLAQQEGVDHVFITGRRKDVLDTAVAEIGDKATGVAGDVANLNDLDRLCESVKRCGRRLDVIFANAGIALQAPFGNVDEEFFDLHFDANVKGLFFSVQKGLPFLNDGGSIILNASIATTKGFPGISVYSATKAALPSAISRELR